MLTRSIESGIQYPHSNLQTITDLNTAPQTQAVYKVSQLVSEMRKLMEMSYPQIWIEGELSSLSTPASGHLYFSLKDDNSQLRCAMFKGRVNANKYCPKEGDLVKVRAKISVYPARGDLQCIVQHIEEAGEGLLKRRFEELKEKLNRQGLFVVADKKLLPQIPQHIGIITSPSGAAVRDILTTLSRRCPGIPVTIYPAVVQGESAAESLIQALQDAVTHQQCDVLVLSRGGGSLEDLWCFNDEALALAIHDCPIPIISGVGHEVDVTIADLVADLRAPTPTAAAQMLSPDTEAVMQQVRSLLTRLNNATDRLLQGLAQNVDSTGKQLIHPRQQFKQKQLLLQQLDMRLQRQTQSNNKHQLQLLSSLQQRFRSATPDKLIQIQRQQLNRLAQNLVKNQQQQLKTSSQQITALQNQLNAVSPKATLQRGFAIVRNESSAIIRSGEQVKLKDKLQIELGSGSIESEVESITHD